MTTYFIWGALVIYTGALLYITFYCMLQFQLLYYYQRNKKKSNLPDEPKVKESDLPMVTVQLPIFNEMYVVDRLIDCISELEYPKEKLQIQILDDSTDETVEISKKKVEEYKKKGFDIELRHRVDRTGFKAGALKAGMDSSKGEFIAIFDADFLPRKDFLKRTIPYFQNDEVGVVQTRWEHINEDYSLITKLQALQLNVHFTVEQNGRSAGNHLLQFNGTAGVWRRETIETAGGWEADTLTEDLDLSIRAQLKGWRIVFLEGIGSPAELPAEMNGLKSQQFRWMKGGAETAKKMLPTVWRSNLPFMTKIHATGHLMASAIFVFVFLIGVFSVPLIFGMNEIGISPKWFTWFLVGWISIISIYYVANVSTNFKKEPFGKRIFKFLFLFPLFLALSMGLSLHNSIAVLQGYWGKKSPFVRTPKFNLQNITDSFSNRNYLMKKISWTTIGEGILAIYFAGGFMAGLQFQNYTFLVFHLLLMLGYGTIFFFTIRHLRMK